MNEGWTEEDEELERAFDLLDEGRYAELHAQLRAWAERGHDEPLAGVLACQMFVGLGQLDDARTQLERARAVLPADDPQLLWAAGEWALAAWRPEEAREAFREIARVAPEVFGYLRLSLCEDLCGDYEASDRALLELQAFEPDGFGKTGRYSPDAFEAIVARAAERLPPQFRDVFEHTAVVIDPVPRRELARGREVETPPDLLGLFVGFSALERSVEASGEVPAVIYLFQRNLERACADRIELEDQIAITLYHELGHLLGFDEEGVDGMGLG